jgi:hypothetical protein
MNFIVNIETEDTVFNSRGSYFFTPRPIPRSVTASIRITGNHLPSFIPNNLQPTSNLNLDDVRMLFALAYTLQTSCYSFARQFRIFQSDMEVENLEGALLIENMFTGRLSIAFLTSRRLETNETFKISAITYDKLLDFFNSIHQSNESLRIQDLNFIFRFNPNQFVSGSGRLGLPPWYVTDEFERFTWETHEHEETTINCAALAITMHEAKEHDLSYDVLEKAKEMMETYGWGKKVYFKDLEDLVKTPRFRHHRIIVHMAGAKDLSYYTYTGVFYQLEKNNNGQLTNECKKKTIFLHHTKGISRLNSR